MNTRHTVKARKRHPSEGGIYLHSYVFLVLSFGRLLCHFFKIGPLLSDAAAKDPMKIPNGDAKTKMLNIIK